MPRSSAIRDRAAAGGSQTALAGSPGSSADRLSVTIIFAAIVHALLVLGISFDALDPDTSEPLPSLDIILVAKQSQEAPEQADFLAQANQAGGGQSDAPKRPAAPVSGTLPKPDPGPSPAPSTPSEPPPQAQQQVQVVTAPQAQQQVDSRPQEEPQPQPRRPSVAQLRNQAQEIARLEAEIDQRLEAYAKRPRREFISANTRQFDFATYMQAWVDKVERVGNLNYPDEARRRRLSGALVLSVALLPDGNIESLRIIKPSGYKVLDDAAIRIVELAAPYAPFTPEIAERVDILHITRTWRFLPGGFSSER